MLTRVLPHPLLTLTLTIVWIMLANELSMGTLVAGIVLGILLPVATQPFWPDRPRLQRPLKTVEYTLLVMWDIAVANVQVARIILTRSNDQLRSHYMVIPLALRSPEAIAVLASTITLTPGTVSADLSADGRALLVHALDVEDPEAVVDEIKNRYERRLLEIFP